jgi:hypothetical protein
MFKFEQKSKSENFEKTQNPNKFENLNKANFFKINKFEPKITNMFSFKKMKR